MLTALPSAALRDAGRRRRGGACPAQSTALEAAAAMQTAVLAGGCFWGVEGGFRARARRAQRRLRLRGRREEHGALRDVGTGLTGHAESVQITFDPAVVTYGELLRIFFSVAHDPTQLNRQGPDTGTQYRSAIFYADDAQRNLARSYIARAQQVRQVPGRDRHARGSAEGVLSGRGLPPGLHREEPAQSLCVFNDLPKIRDLKRLYPEYYQELAQR